MLDPTIWLLPVLQGRTTAAVTGLQGYVGDNVLPPSVTLNVNFRLLPGDSVAGVMGYLQGVIGPEWVFTWHGCLPYLGAWHVLFGLLEGLAFNS